MGQRFGKGVRAVQYDRTPISMDGSHLPLRPAEAQYKLNDKTMSVLVEAWELGATDRIACGAAGINVGTIVRWKRLARELAKQLDEGTITEDDLTYEQQAYLNFLSRYETAVSKVALDALRVVKRAADVNEEWQAAKWILEARHGFHPITQMSIRGTGANGAVRVEHDIPPMKRLNAQQKEQLESLRLGDMGELEE